MKFSLSLPEPSADALNHSQNLVSAIREEIQQNDSSISFRRYMEMALYQPGLGYYVSGINTIGHGGDFVTAPEASSLFSYCVAAQCAEILQKVGGCLLELGAGSGAMALDVLLELERLQQLPDEYLILELSPVLRQQQQQKLKERAPHLFQRVRWLEVLPESFGGVVIGNEVLDAMPVDLFTQQNESVYEHHVIWQEDTLLQQIKPANEILTQQVTELNIDPQSTPYTSEINPNLLPWLEAINDRLQRGVLLLIDYGYVRPEYYHPERNMGTLICHYQHRVNQEPLHYPGLQDITASVDFTALAEAADSCGLQVAGFTTQAAFLQNSGLEKYFSEALEANPKAQYSLAQQVRMLSLPADMGERFKVIALSKKYQESISGFANNDQRFRL